MTSHDVPIWTLAGSAVVAVVLTMAPAADAAGGALRRGTPPPGTAAPPVKLVTLQAAGTGAAFDLSGTYQGVTGGTEGTAWVSLTGPAPSPELMVRLAIQLPSDKPGLARLTQNFVRVPGGQTAATFTFTTEPVTAATSFRIVASDDRVAKEIPVTVLPARVLRVEVPAGPLISGAELHGRVVLTGPPAQGSPILVALAISKPEAASVVTSGVSIPFPQREAGFTIKTKGVASQTPIAVTGSYAGQGKTGTFTLVPATLKSLSPGRLDCGSPCTTTASVNLTGIAPPEGLTLKFTSSKPDIVQVPASVTIAPHTSNASFSVTAPSVASGVSATVWTSLGTVTQAMAVMVHPPQSADLFVKSVAITDRYGQQIARPPDSQPFTVCASVANRVADALGGATAPFLVRFALRFSHGGELERDVPTVVPPNANKEDVWTDGHHEHNYFAAPPPCSIVPGLDLGQHVDVTIVVDPKNVIKERKSSNNTHKFRVSRQ